MSTIYIFRGSDSWMARFEDDREFVESMGTDTVPTPYTLAAAGETVRDAIAQRNPESVVTLLD